MGIPAPCLAHRHLVTQADCDDSAPRRLRVRNLPAIRGTGGSSGYDSRLGLPAGPRIPCEWRRTRKRSR